MKVYKSEPDKYGWYFIIHKLNGGSLKLIHKNNQGRETYDFHNFRIWRNEELKLLKKVINSK